MKKLIALSCLFLSLNSYAAWWNQEEKHVEKQQSIYNKAQPYPLFDYSLERELVTQLYVARNSNVATHTVWRSDYGLVEGDCASVGYGIPYDTSLTNPLRREANSYGATTVEQAEPNGLYASKNTSATWVQCSIKLDTGEVVSAPIYIEGKVTVYPFPVSVDYESNRVKPISGAKPTVTIKDNK